MLELDEKAWSGLAHAYGEASDIPAHLRTLYSDPQAIASDDPELWEPLWGSLCHQADIYTASIAATPHVVNAAVQALDEGRSFAWSCIALPVAIEDARARHPFLAVDETYFNALRRINRLIDHAKEHRLAAPFGQVVREAEKILRELRLRDIPQAPADDGVLFWR